MATKIGTIMVRGISIAELANMVKGRVVGSFDERLRITGY